MAPQEVDSWFQWSSNHNAVSVLKNLHAQYSSRQFCDINLTIGTATYWAHRAVLSAASPYFNAMFSIDMVESDKTSVDIHGVSPEIFKLLLEFIYTGELPVCEDNCQQIIIAANMFQLEGALKLSCGFLAGQLHSSNSLGIHQFAESQGCTALIDISRCYINSNFIQIIKEDEFTELSKDRLLLLLKNEDLQIDNEFQVFEAAMSWILHDVFHRRTDLFTVLRPIRFPMISTFKLARYILDCEDLSLRVALSKLTEDYKRGPDRNLKEAKPDLYVPRKGARKRIFVVGGYRREIGGRWNDSITLPIVSCFNTFHKSWITFSTLQHARSGHGVCVRNGFVYVIGGENESLIYDSVECMDPETGSWSLLGNMTVPRCGLGVCTVGDHIYAIGGWIGTDIGNSVEMYDIHRDKWTVVDTMQTARFAMGVVEYEDNIYLIGGMNEIGVEMNLVECYSPVNKEWKTLCPMRVSRAHVGVAILNGFIYAVGGFNETNGALNDVEKYSIEENVWSKVPSMQEKRAGACVAAVDGLLYVMGGRTLVGSQDIAAHTLSTVECYDPQTESWFEISMMQTGCCDAGVAVV